MANHLLCIIFLFNLKLETDTSLSLWNYLGFPFLPRHFQSFVPARMLPMFSPPAGHAQRCSRQGAFWKNNITVGQSSNDETPPNIFWGSLFSKHSKQNDFLGSWNRCFFNCICICVSCFCVFVCFCCPISETPLNNTIQPWNCIEGKVLWWSCIMCCLGW